MVNKLTGLEGGLEVGQKINEIIDNKADVNADTTGNAGTATKLKNARTITLSGDVSGSYSFDGSVNKTVTTTLNNTTKIDGQWVSKTETLSTATAVGTYTIDLSSYLPNDNYNYEVLLNGYCNRSNDSSDLTGVIFYSDILTDYENYENFMSVSSNTRDGCVHVILPVENNVYMQIKNKTLRSNYIKALAYRRIGTNT